MILSLAAILTVNLSGAVDHLMPDAKAPHFMQMHSGVLDMTALNSFVSNNSNVADFQVLQFLNVDNAKITLGGNSLTDSLQDNGFSIRSQEFDFLVDLNYQSN